jgi:hypothetical protein
MAHLSFLKVGSNHSILRLLEKPLRNTQLSIPPDPRLSSDAHVNTDRQSHSPPIDGNQFPSLDTHQWAE